MKKLLLLLGITIVITSCGQRETTDYYYRVKFITSNAKTVVKSTERGVETYGSYRVGDTLHVTKDNVVTENGRFRKAVVINIIP